MITYASILDSRGNEYFGKSQGLQITKTMFDWIKAGQFLNKVIEEIMDSKENKKGNGISGYLTSGYYYRSHFDSTAVISAIQFMKNRNTKFEEINKKIKSRKIN